MDITLLVCVLVAFVAGAVLMFFFKKNSKSVNEHTSDLELKTENDSLRNQITELEKRLESSTNGASKEVEEIKTKFENLLKEANERCVEMDKQLKSALEGNLDDSIKEQFANIEKLKKKIRNLEDDLEEKEDDIDDLKKKIRNRDEEIAQQQDELRKERKGSKKLSEELTSAKSQLDDTVEELNLKIGSLNFIQEILSAKEISTSDTVKLNKSIDVFESFVKGQFIDISSYLFTTYNFSWKEKEGKDGLEEKKRYFSDAFDQWAATKKKSWLYGKTTIAFVGEFSAGKTSIVNRILSQDNPEIPTLPVSTKATTAIPTYIAGGASVSYSFISADDKRKTILETTFKKISKEVLNEINGVSSLIKYFVMTYKNPNLNGLSILDTPGFNSNDSEDKERTIEVINECDALFWVFDVNVGTVNRSSISIIKEKLNKPLYVVINKVDTKADSEVQKVENLIKKTLSDEGLTVQQFIRFSSKAPLSSIMSPIQSVNKTTVRDTFVSEVKEDIENLKNVLESEVKTANENYNKAVNEGEDITNQAIDCMRQMQTDCVEACSIPEWVEHWFSSDKFEMDREGGERLMGLLEQIADKHINDLVNKFDESVEKAQEIQQEWSDLCDLKTAWQKVNECFEHFKVVSKNIS